MYLFVFLYHLFVFYSTSCISIIDLYFHDNITTGDGEVDFIPDYISEVMSPEYSLSKAREWFKLEDTNKDGYVSEAELVTIAMNIGMTKDDAEKTASEYYMSADTNGDRLLDWDGKENTAMIR